MINFFRRIRKRHSNENRFIKYSRYAIGEILLVVFGILIALQVNNLNHSSNEAKEITNYFHRIHLEFEKSTEQIQIKKEFIDTLLTQNERSLYLLNLKNKDSLVQLKETLGALGTASISNLNFPMFEEFINQGFLAKVKMTALSKKCKI